jgi:transcriptional regulator with XRE-family HTH domain
MTIGTKIKKLRENQNITQDDLTLQLGISQTTLHNIESDKPQKIDFLLMDKVCNIFDKDFSYFANEHVINNNVKDNKGQISCENFTINNHYPESILVEIQKIIDENKWLKSKITTWESKNLSS